MVIEWRASLSLGEWSIVTAQLDVVRHTSAPATRPAIATRAQWQSQYIGWLRVCDAVAVVVAVAVAQHLRFNAGTYLVYWPVDYAVVTAAIGAAWFLALVICHARSPHVIGAGTEEYRRVWTATAGTFGGVAIVSMLFRLDIARGYLAIAMPLGLLLLFAGRNSARRIVTRKRWRGQFQISVLAVGEPRSLRALTQSLAREPRYGYTVVGACIPGGTRLASIDVPQVGRLPIYGDENDIGHAIAASHADTVALTATEHLGPQGIRDLSWALEKLNVDLLVSPGVTDVANPRVIMRAVAGLPLLHLDKPQYSGAKHFKKRAFDVCFSIMALALAAPVMIAFAIAIKLTSQGPVFYMSERIGLEGRPFRMIKFRTMVVGADKCLDGLLDLNESKGGVLFKIRDDPRVTPIGRFLRKYSLDELPQFINVLRGDMSVVGPRPPLPREVAKYDYSVRRRLLVSPGITGLWQISGRSDLSWEDSVRLDLSYVENWSMISDLLIAIKTMFVVLRGAGAY